MKEIDDAKEPSDYYQAMSELKTSRTPIVTLTLALLCHVGMEMR